MEAGLVNDVDLVHATDSPPCTGSGFGTGTRDSEGQFIFNLFASATCDGVTGSGDAVYSLLKVSD